MLGLSKTDSYSLDFKFSSKLHASTLALVDYKNERIEAERFNIVNLEKNLMKICNLKMTIFVLKIRNKLRSQWSSTKIKCQIALLKLNWLLNNIMFFISNLRIENSNDLLTD